MAKTIEQFTDHELQTIIDRDAPDQLGPAGSIIREMELVERLRELGEEVEPFTPLLSAEESFQRDQNIQKILNRPGMGVADPTDVRDNYPIFETGQQLNKIGFVETLTRIEPMTLLPFVGSLYKTEQILKVLNAAQRLGLPDGSLVDDLDRPHYVGFESVSGPVQYSKIPVDDLRGSDMKLVTDWIVRLNEEQERGFSIRGRIAQGIAELPAFMVEFLLTGPIFKTGSVAARTAATKILGRFAEKGVGKLAVKVAAAGFGSLLRTSVNVPRILAGTVENMSEGIQVTDDGAVIFADAEVNPFSALARSFTELFIENISEITGASLKKGALAVGKGIGKRFPVIQKFSQTLADKWIANRAGRTLSGFLKFSATKVGYDGILEEFGEERIGAMLRAVTGLGSFGEIIPTWEEMLVEAGVFTIIPVGISLSRVKLFRKDLPSAPVEKRLGLMTTQEFRSGLEAITKLEAPEEAKIKEQTVETKAKGIMANVKEAAVEPLGTIDAIRRNVSRAEDALGHWGTAGIKVQRDLREISARTAKNVGNTSQNIRGILKGLNAQEKTIVTQLTDGAISSEGKPARLVTRAKTLKEQLDIMQKEAISVGLRKAELTGRAFPQIPNKKGIEFLREGETKGAQSHRIFAWAQQKVNDGKFKNVDSAIAALQNYRKNRLRGTVGYFEGERLIELKLDERVWSPDVILPGIVEGGWEAIEGARQWGVTEGGDFKDIRTSIERIRQEVGVDQATLLEDYINAQYGKSRASVVARKWNKWARSVQFVGKLALSPLTITRNMLDRYAKGLTHGTIGANIRATIKFPPFLNRYLKTSQKIQDEMIRRGAVLGHGHLSEGFASGGAISRFIGQPFALSERGNQTYIAIVKKLQLEADIRRLNEMGGENGTVGKMYNRMLSIIGQSQLQTRKRVLTNLTNEQLSEALAKEEINDDVMSEVLHRVVTDSAFPLTLASKRMWWGNRPFIQTAAQFKIWTVDQMRFMYKDVLKYTLATGDPSRLFRFILGTWLAGELYNIARDFLTNKDESLASTLKDPDGRNFTEISKSMANAMADGGFFGILADLTYGITDWAFGPTVGSIESAVRVAVAVKNDPATTIDGLKKFLLDDIPAAKQAQGVLDRIDRTFFDENNLTENYSEWRQRSFEFRRKTGELSAIERTTGRAVFGRPTRLPGPRTLSHEMIARQVLVGDFDDAADYIKGILRDAPAEKIKEVFQGIQTSGRNRSPFGNISQKNLPLFLSQFSAQGQANGIKLQAKWMSGYQKSMQIALAELQEEGFTEELKAKGVEFVEETLPLLEKFKATLPELRKLLKE